MVVNLHKKKGKRRKCHVYIGRRMEGTEFTEDSKWANFFYDRLDLYEEHVRRHLWDDLEELRGKILGCWCVNTKYIKPIVCHGQVLLKLVREKRGRLYGQKEKRKERRSIVSNSKTTRKSSILKDW